MDPTVAGNGGSGGAVAPNAGSGGTTGGSGSSGSGGSAGGGGSGGGTGGSGSGGSTGGSGSGGSTGGSGSGGSGGSGSSGSGGSVSPPPVGGSDPIPPRDPNARHPIDVLNPKRCDTDEPFVLAIDRGGMSGTVQGWLESAPSVLFDEYGLPRFTQQGGPAADEDDLGLWWSIARFSARDRSLWFYPANESTEVAHVSAQRFSDIGDASDLPYESDWDGPVAVGEIAVFHHIPTDRYLAVQVVDLYGAERNGRRHFCSAIEARWMFGEQGTGRF